MNEQVEKKFIIKGEPRIKILVTSISIITGVLLIVGRFWAVASSATEMKMEIKHLKEEVVELKASHTTFKEITERLGEINVRLGKIETRLDIEKEE